MSEAPRNRRQQVLRVAALFALAAGLAAVAFLFRAGGEAGDAKPLYPNDVMRLWPKASGAQKWTTAELLLNQMERDGILGPRTGAALADPGGKQKLIDELVAALDASTNPSRTEYVSPSQPIALTAIRVAAQMGWNQ